MEDELIQILESLLERNEHISARAVARVHSHIKHASTITRSSERMKILNLYKEKQARMRSQMARLKKTSEAASAKMLTERDQKIAQLESQLENLIGSHVILLRHVCEMGGVRALHEFYSKFREVRDTAKVIKFSSQDG